jgi:hypothetical protein
MHGTMQFALETRGLHLGFVAGTDGHDTRPGETCALDALRPHPYGGGLTVAVIDEGTAFDRGALYDALVARRVYATSGPFLPATVWLSAGDTVLGGMGEEVTIPAGQDLDVEVRVPEPAAPFVLAARLVGPDATFWDLVGSGGSFTVRIPADRVPSFLYAELAFDGLGYEGRATCEDGGETDDDRVWLSPTWISIEEEPTLDSAAADGAHQPRDRGCGCAAGPAAAPGLAFALLSIVRRRR